MGKPMGRTLTYDILRCIHEQSDIPERRRMESACGWGITGIRKLKESDIDPSVIENVERRYYRMDLLNGYLITLPIPYNREKNVPMKKAYQLPIPYGGYEWKKDQKTMTKKWYLCREQFKFHSQTFNSVSWKLIPYVDRVPTNDGELDYIILMTHIRKELMSSGPSPHCTESYELYKDEDGRKKNIVSARYTIHIDTHDAQRE